MTGSLQIRDFVPRCPRCQVRVVGYPNLLCLACKEEERVRKVAMLVLLLVLCAALLAMGLMSAHGEWVRLNLPRP